MKKSNLILLGTLAVILIFTLTFQLTVHQYIKEDNKTRASITRETKERKIPSFTGIKALVPLRIQVGQDSLQKVWIEAPNHLIDSVRTSVINDTLLIEASKNVKKRDSIVVKVTLQLLNHLQLGDKCHIKSESIISGEELYLELTRHSSAQLQLRYESVLYSNSSDGVVDIDGEIETIKIINPQKK
nr:DUF2807 domain-containing protein [Allomuricauda sp.]